MPKLVVVNEAVLRCIVGSTPSPLTVTTPNTPQVNGSKTATILDNQSGINIKPFGVCGITGGDCLPVTPAPWLPGEVTIPISQFPILPADSLLLCNAGGIIEITSPGQTFFFVDSPLLDNNKVLREALLDALSKIGGKMKNIILDVLDELGADKQNEPSDSLPAGTFKDLQEGSEFVAPFPKPQPKSQPKHLPDCTDLPYIWDHPYLPPHRLEPHYPNPEGEEASRRAWRSLNDDYDEQQTRQELSDDKMSEPPPVYGKGQLQKDAEDRIKQEALSRSRAYMRNMWRRTVP